MVTRLGTVKDDLKQKPQPFTHAEVVSRCLQAGMPSAVVAQITGHDVKTLYRDDAGCIVARPEIPDLY